MNDFHSRCDSKENINTTLTLQVLLITRLQVRLERFKQASERACVGACVRQAFQE